MYMRSEAQRRLAVLMLVGATGLLAQDSPLPSGSIQLNLPNDSPVAVLSMASDQSRASSRGAAMVLDLHMALTLRNASANRIHGVTLRVVTQEATMGGKNWVTIPSLNVAQGEVFPVRIDMQLVRPAQTAGGPLVHVDLDGVLFQDLSFYGPDRLNSRRILTAYELEAQRDREHFKRVLAQGGKEGLRKQVLESISRQSELSPLTVRVRRGGQAVTSAAVAPEHPAQFAFLQFPDSPVEPLEGWVQIAGNEARAPRIEVKNRSNRAVKYVELGWVVSDQAGKQYMAGSLPSSEANLNIPPGQTARVLQESSLSFLSDGRPVNVRKMTGFINQVQFADGKVWVPSRQSLDDPMLQRTMAPSNEELRLSDLYRRKGIDALMEELKKY
jgi:hypothetical protein